MKKLIVALSFILCVPAFAATEMGNPEIGKPAPEFMLKDANGKTFSLKDHKDKTVVLEWVNYECPFVRKHYDSGNMQAMQKEETGKGVVWYSIISSAPGEQGYLEGKDLIERTKKEKNAATATLLDPDGKVGKAYGAQTTPHMYVIEKGTLVYKGAIDDTRSTDVADVKTAKNFVKLALEASRNGRTLASKEADTKAYGCGIKYKK